MIKRSNKKYSTTICLSSLCLFFSLMRTWECEVCITEGERLPIYIPFKWLNKHIIGAYLSSLTGLTSPRQTPNTHYMMLHWGVFPWLTIEVVPQGPYTIIKPQKEENTSLMGVQQHTMIIYIRISSEVTNTST